MINRRFVFSASIIVFLLPPVHAVEKDYLEKKHTAPESILIDITDHSEVSYDSVYFGFFHDFDIGEAQGGVNEYVDDLLDFDSDNNFIYAYDADNYSSDWGMSPGVMGITFLETPRLAGSMAGITDMHFGRMYLDDETLMALMALMSSNLDYLPADIDHRDFFYTGNSPSIHFDDLDTQPEAGDDVHGTIASGPFDLSPTDTLTFIIGIIAGTNEADLYTNLQIAQDLHANNFVAPKPPPSPTLARAAGHNEITLYWTNATEGEPDELSGARDFEGYRLYKSIDRGLSWDQIDRNVVPDIGLEPIPFTSFDRVNGWGDDVGLQYTFADNSLIDGIEYWYSITAFDHGNSLLGSLESAIGNTIEIINIDTKTVYWDGLFYVEEPYPFGDGFIVTFHRADTQNIPSSGDLLSLNFCAELLRYDGQDTIQVIFPQRFDLDRELVSDDGLQLILAPQAEIQNISNPPILDFEIELEVADSDLLQDMDYQITITNSDVDADNNTFIVIRTTDEDLAIIGEADTVYSGGTLQFRGVIAGFEFFNRFAVIK